MRKLWILGIGIVMWVGPGLTPPFAAEKPDTQIKMSEVVVSASKTREQRKDLSQSIITLDDADIDASPATSIGDLLGGAPGVDWRTRGDYGGAAQEIHIRGMQGDGTQVLVNGVTFNSPSFGTADVGRIPINAVERIEVVKGSGSVLYGSGATGGTVNIVTKSPKRGQTDLEVTAGYGTQRTYQLSAAHGRFVSEDVGYFITANTTDTQGFRENGDHFQADTSMKWVLDKGSHFLASLYADLIYREYGRPGPAPPKGTQPFAVNGTPFYNDESANLLNEMREQDTHVVLKAQSRPLSWLGLNFQTDYTHMVSDDRNRNYNSSSPGNLPGDLSEITNDILGVEGNIELTPFQGATLLAGVQHKQYGWKNTKVTLNGFGNPASRLKGSNDLHTTGLFGEVQYRPSRYVKAIAGVRQEDHSEFGSEMLPRYGLVVNPFETTAMKFNTGRHYMAPTPNDLFWPLEDWGYGSGAQGNPDLEPEIGWHTDAVIEQTLANELIFLSVGYFQWDIDDKIDWMPDQNLFFQPKNLSSYEASGWELGTRIGPVANMTFSLNYTYTDAKEQKPGGVKRQGRYTAENFLKAGLTYWFDFGLDLTTTIRITDERPARYENDTDARPSQDLSSYWTIDLKANQRLATNWMLSIQMNNLLDESYDTYVEAFDDQTGNRTISDYPGAGQSMFVGLTYTY